MNDAERRLGEAAREKIRAQERLDAARGELKRAAKDANLKGPVSVHLDGECLTISPPSFAGSLPIVKRFKRIA